MDTVQITKMGVEMTVCKLVLVSVLCHVSAAPGCELEQIFETPRKNYDKLEIMERSNFDASDSGSGSGSSAGSNTPVAPPVPAIGTPEMPRSIANAQIMLRFGNGAGSNPEPKICSCGRFCQCGRTPLPVHPPLGFPGVYYVLPPPPQHQYSPVPQPHYSSVPQHYSYVPQHYSYVPQHYSHVPQHYAHVPQHYAPVPQHYAPVPQPHYSPVPQHNFPVPQPHYAPVLQPHIAPVPQPHSPVPQHHSPVPQPQYPPMPSYVIPGPQYPPHYLPQMPHLPQIEHPVSLPDVRASKPQPTMIIIAKQRVLQKPLSTSSSSSTPEPPATQPENKPISNNHPQILQPIELSNDDLGTDKVTNEMIEAQIQKLEQKEMQQQLAQKLQEQRVAHKQELAQKLQDEIVKKLQEEQVRHAIAEKLQGIPAPQSHVKFVPVNFENSPVNPPVNPPVRNPRIEAAVNEALIPYILKEQKPKLMVSYPIFNNEVPEVPRNLHKAEPKFQYSGYKITSGSGYYEDPYQRIVYNPPAVMSVMKAQTLEPRHNFDCQCASCARYTKELNE